MNWKALVVAALCLLSSKAVEAKKLTPDVTREEWTYLCSSLRDMGYSRVDCRKIDKPIIVISDVVADATPAGWVYYGFTYTGEPYVFINSELSVVEQRSVIVHETTHYVLDQSYGILVGECESEKVARIIQHKWDGTNYAEDLWYIDYKCKP